MTKTWLLLAAGLALIGLAGCNRILSTQQARVNFQKAEPVENVSKVVVETRNGSIAFRCEHGLGQAEITGTKYAQGATVEQAEADLERIEIRVERPANQPGVLRIAAVFPRDVKGGASFDLALPDSVMLDLSTSNGSETVTGPARDVRAETSNGSIKATGVAGNVTVNTSNGSVTLEDVAGDVDAISSNGRILLKRVGRTQVVGRTSNGSIEAQATRGDVQLTSSNGRITWTPEALPDKPDVRIATNNSSVRVDVPRDVHASVHLNTSNSSVHANFSGAQVGDLHSGRNSVSAVLNGGGGRIDVRTSNGRIELGLIAPQATSRPAAASGREAKRPQPVLESEAR